MAGAATVEKYVVGGGRRVSPQPSRVEWLDDDLSEYTDACPGRVSDHIKLYPELPNSSPTRVLLCVVRK